MAVLDNTHSRIVFWLKILLPLAALALLSTLFLFSRRIDTDLALPYAEVNVEELARSQRLTAPEFAGVTRDGASVTIHAAAARPEENGGATVESVSVMYESPGGLRIAMDADEGILDDRNGQVTLAGNVAIATSSGYRLTAARLDGALDRTELQSDGAVHGEAPFGVIDAGDLRISHADDEGYVMVFSSGVKLVYHPASKDKE